MELHISHLPHSPLIFMYKAYNALRIQDAQDPKWQFLPQVLGILLFSASSELDR